MTALAQSGILVKSNCVRFSNPKVLNRDGSANPKNAGLAESNAGSRPCDQRIGDVF